MRNYHKNVKSMSKFVINVIVKNIEIDNTKKTSIDVFLCYTN